MKAIQWMQFMDAQRREHGKTVFSVTELANAADTTLHALNVELGRLLRQGIIVRYARGKYGPPNDVSPEELVTVVDARAYLTGAYALYRHNLITQVPVEVTCFTNRRHNRSRVRTTPVGKFVFVCVSPGIYCQPADGVMAGPEQALCDLVYVLSRRGIRPESLVTFRNLHKVRPSEQVLERYPASVQRTVATVLK